MRKNNSNERSGDLAMLIMNAGRLLHQKLHAGAGEQFSMLHCKIMRYVGEKGNATMKDLAGFLGITPPSATVLVARLVRSGELSRVPGKDDRRSVGVVLTPVGRKHINEARRAMAKRMDAVIASLPRGDVGRLASILKKLLK